MSVFILARELLSEKWSMLLRAKNSFHSREMFFGLNIKRFGFACYAKFTNKNLSGENFESWLRKKLKVAVAKSQTVKVAE
jgi:hypothetical protein